MTVYEWNIEGVEIVNSDNISEYQKVHPEMKVGDWGDVQGHRNEDKLIHFMPEYLTYALEEVMDTYYRNRLVLVRDDEYGRSWACVKNKKLPKFFEDSYGVERTMVPQRFHDELANV